MARFLSDEWVEAFNAAVKGSDLGLGTGSGSVRADSGSFSVEERVTGVPGRQEQDGPLRIVLRVADGEVTLAGGADAPDERADVVVSLTYEDAAALSRGELDATQALATGRVHVRGDLSVLMAGQGLLASAAGRMAELEAQTTY